MGQLLSLPFILVGILGLIASLIIKRRAVIKQ